MIDINKIQFSNEFSGFGNDASDMPFSASYAGSIIAAGKYFGPVRATLSLTNTDDIGQIKVRFTGLESFYRVVNGSTQVDYPNTGSRTYSVQINTYYSGGLFYVDSYIVNQSGSSVTVPAITFDCIASTFLTPF
jgi:hypothetical protein